MIRKEFDNLLLMLEEMELSEQLSREEFYKT